MNGVLGVFSRVDALAFLAWVLLVLIGLAAVAPDGERLGTVIAVHDFGAGEMLEIEQAGRKTLLLPFTKAAVPQVDLAGGRLVVVPPPEVEARGDTETPQGDDQ